MKILWMSNREVINENIAESGSWLVSMASLFHNRDGVLLYNITQSNLNSSIVYKEKDNIKEWVLPKYKLTSKGIPSKKNITSIIDIIKFIEPDIIHIWGVESYWGLLVKHQYISGKILLDIQGCLYACHRAYMGGITFADIIKVQSIGKALYSYSFILLQKYRMYRRLKYEESILHSINNIAVQSNWTKNKILAVNMDAKLYHSPMALRKAFLESPKWKLKENSLEIVTIISPQAYKGIHVTLMAIALLKKNIPNIRLKLIGDIYAKSHKGYPLFLLDLINKLKLNNNVYFLGPLDSNNILSECLNSRALVISSFVESYSLVLAEAMMIGIPCVVSYAGAMPELAEDKISALFYSPNDVEECADRIKSILESNDLSYMLSKNAILKSQGRHFIESVYKQQIHNYNDILC